MNKHKNIMHIDKIYAWKETSPVEKYFLIMAMELAHSNLSSDLEKKMQKKENYTDSEL